MIKLQLTGKVEVKFFKEDDMIVAFCPALDLSTCGRDINEAKKNFEESLQIYLEETIKHGILERDLMSHGWKAVDLALIPPDKPYRSIPTHILKTMQIPIPLAC